MGNKPGPFAIKPSPEIIQPIREKDGYEDHPPATLAQET